MPQNTSVFPTVIAGPPAHIRLGPLTQRLLAGSKWQGVDQFPAWQVWADDVESVLAFFDRENRLPAFFTMIQKARTPQHRDASLAEARGSFFLNQNGFRILEWEPQGEGTTKGEVLVGFPGSPDIFVEVKQPSWHGEFLPLGVAERKRLGITLVLPFNTASAAAATISTNLPGQNIREVAKTRCAPPSSSA